MEGILELLELQIEGLRSIQDNQVIDFESRDKLMQVDGLNKDTGGSSGAGKSTIAIAIDYLFGVSILAGTVLKPWDGGKTPKVSGKFRRNGITIVITRSTKDGLTILVGDEKTSGNSKQAEEKLDEVIGLPRDIFKRLIHKRQDDGSFFVKMTPKEKYEFLIKILNLETKNLDLAFLEDEAKECIKKLDTLNVSIDSQQKSVQELDDIIQAKIRPECSILDEDITALENSINLETEELVSVKALKAAEVLEFTPPVKTTITGDDTKLLELQVKKNTIKDNITNLLKQHNDKVEAARRTLKEAEQGIAAIEVTKNDAKRIGQSIQSKKLEHKELSHNAKCSNCKQSWTGQGADKKLAALSLEIDKLTEQAMSFRPILEGESDLLKKISVLTPHIESIRLEKPQVHCETELDAIEELIINEKAKLSNVAQAAQNEYLAAQNVYLNSISAVNATYNTQIEELTNKINSLTQEKMLLNTQLASYKKNLERFDREMQGLHDKLSEKSSELDKSITAQSELSLKIGIIKESSRCLKSYILNVFQDTLTTIGETATEIVNNIPNVSTATIFFEGFKETAKGGVKNEINAILSKSGVPDIPVKALCGGEGCAIGLAIDLAVIDVIESKANKGTNFYVMDEPFNGLDSVCREDCLEIIKGIDTNKKIIIIDHCNELKEIVSDVVMAVKENDITTII